MLSHKKTTLLLLAALAITVVTAVASLRNKVQDNSTLISQQEEPTPIQEGVMSVKQKKHSKLYKGYSDVIKGKKLRDLVAEQGDVNITRLIGDVGVPASFVLDEYLHGLACKADAIVVGTVKSKSSQMTEDGTFIFTDYEITVTDIIKNNVVAPIQPNTDVTVTRIGGTVILNSRKVRTIDQRRNILKKAEYYLLFLEYIPTTGAYKAFSDSRSEDSFQIFDNKITQVSAAPLPFGPQVTTDAESFLAKVRSALTTSCQ